MTAKGFEPDFAMWRPWRPADVAQRLAGLDVPWCVVGGWAVDLFLGRTTRDHEDLEIAVPAHRWDELRGRLADFEFFVAGSGLAWPLATAGEAFAEHHQTWMRDPSTSAWVLDVFRDPAEGDDWICRRDPRIRRPYAEVIARTADGVPYAVPEIVLLFKAKATRSKDEADLANALPSMTVPQRRWLADALSIAHPGHPWLAALDGGRAGR